MKFMRNLLILLLAVCSLFVAAGTPAFAAEPVYVSKDMVKEAYYKYVRPYAGPEGGLSVTDENIQGDMFNQKVLSMVNFVRACSGVAPVTLDDSLSYYSQAGIDFLEERNLEIDHHAAEGVDDVADTGLSNSNLVSGTSGYLGASRTVLCCIADKGLNNLINAGHRRWLLDDTRHSIGVGYSDDGTLARGAIYVNSEPDGSKGSVIACPGNGVYPIEIYSEVEASCPTWSVMFGGGWNPEIRVPDNPAEVSVRITRDDGVVLDLPYADTVSEGGDWFTIPESLGMGSGGGLTISPGSFLSEGVESLAGRSFRVDITGLADGESISYTTAFAHLKDLIGKEVKTPVKCTAHSGSIGWLAPAPEGKTSGTEELGCELEALRIDLDPDLTEGGIVADVYSESNGWSHYDNGDGRIIGATGRSSGIEAIGLSLTGELAESYSIAYRVRIMDNGWTDWFCNGQIAGVPEESYLEAVQIKLIPGNSIAKEEF